MKEKVKINIIDKYKNNDTKEREKAVKTLINQLMQKEYSKLVD